MRAAASLRLGARGVAFAGTLMITSGALQAISGPVAIFDDEFYVVGHN